MSAFYVCMVALFFICVHYCSSVEDEIDHYDRSHPVNISTFSVNYTFLTLTWRLPPHENTSDLTNWVVHYHKRSERKSKDCTAHDLSVVVAGNVSHAVIKGLEPGTMYSYCIQANYSTGHEPVSYIFSALTLGYGPDRPCDCDHVGSVDQDCDKKTGNCNCKNKQTLGRKCNSCVKGYYWHESTGCEQCTCASGRSDGTCGVDENGLVKCNCLKDYGGTGCYSCAVGFYESENKTGECDPCNCNNNTRPDASRPCDAKTGNCIACGFNTTGDHCEKCKEGFTGDALARNCTPKDGYFQNKDSARQKTNIIIGVCATLGICLAIVILVIVWQKCRHHKPQLQFWTVELKDDHENVSFSTLMEQPDYQNVDASLLLDDIHGFSRSPYQKTTEEKPDKPIVRTRGGPGGYRTLDDRGIDA